MKAPQLPSDPERELVISELAGAAFTASAVSSVGLQRAFTDLTRVLAHFVRRSLNQPRPYMKESGSGENAKEADLQDDLWEFLQYGQAMDVVGSYEPQRLGGGRADIQVARFGESLVIECKRELKDASNAALVASYAAQGGAYGAAEHPLGVVVTLDLTAKQTGSPPMFGYCLWVYEQTPQEGGRVLLFVRVPGRRVTPSALSK